MALALSAIILFGCPSSHTRSGAVPEASGTTVTVIGDWDDVSAAAIVGVDAIHATIEASRVTDETARFRLRLVDGSPGVLEVTRDGDELIADASLGRFGDPEAEQRLLDAFTRRLEQLHGVDYAPR